jgi:hypothetical protein
VHAWYWHDVCTGSDTKDFKLVNEKMRYHVSLVE